MAKKPDLKSLEEAVAKAIHRIADLDKQNAKLQKELARAKKKATSATSAKSSGSPADPRTAEIREHLERLEQDLGSLLAS